MCFCIHFVADFGWNVRTNVTYVRETTEENMRSEWLNRENSLLVMNTFVIPCCKHVAILQHNQSALVVYIK